MSKLNWYPTADNQIKAAADVNKAGRELLANVRSNWQSESHIVKAIARKNPDAYVISIGTTRAAKRNAHLIEFGGGFHSPRAPTGRAAQSAGYRIRWGGR